MDEVKLVNELLVQQHSNVVSQIKQLTVIQGEIAQQVVKQHEEIEALYIALGLKKDLSYYSFDMSNIQEH